MKIIEASAGVLSNFEVLDFLRNKSNSANEEEKLLEMEKANLDDIQDNEFKRVKGNLTASEMKVYQYLIETAARDQTRECVGEFIQRCKQYGFAQADIVQVLNIRPSEPSAFVELYSLVESCEERFKDDEVGEILQMIDEVLPPRPVAKKDDEELVPAETSNLAEEATAEPVEGSTDAEPMNEIQEKEAAAEPEEGSTKVEPMDEG